MGTTTWEDSIRQWRTTTNRYYRPWTLEDCQTETETVQQELNTFLWSMDTELIVSAFFGWRVHRRILQPKDAVQFSFAKTMYGFAMEDFISTAWHAFTNHDSYTKVMLGDRGRGWLEVLQQLTPDMWIVRCVDRYPTISMDAHMIYLVSRVRTEKRSVQFVRSLHVPEVQRRICQPTDMWATDCVWSYVDALNEDATDYDVHIGGTLSSLDTNYAAEWLMETLAALMRVERVATRRGLLPSDS